MAFIPSCGKFVMQVTHKCHNVGEVWSRLGGVLQDNIFQIFVEFKRWQMGSHPIMAVCMLWNRPV